MRHQTEVAQNVAALKAAGVDADTAPLHEVTGPLTELRARQRHDRERQGREPEHMLEPAAARVRKPGQPGEERRIAETFYGGAPPPLGTEHEPPRHR